jgi:RNase P protein component
VLATLRPGLVPGEARVLAHAAFGLMNSTPFLGEEVERNRSAALLREAAACALEGR